MLYRKVQKATNPDQRAEAMMALASQFAAEHDLLDHEITDDFHEYVEDYVRKRMEFQQASLRLARVAMQVIEQCEAEGAVLPEAPTSPVDRNMN